MTTTAHIHFAFPSCKIPTRPAIANKTQGFSPLSPMGGSKKYSFLREVDYYRDYAQSYFALTCKKAGWDCMRHYEIVASGALPYFLDLESCPADCLPHWPKDLLDAIRQLPGLPTERIIRKAVRKNRLDKLTIDHHRFDHSLYRCYQNKLMQHFSEQLTTDGLANKVLERLKFPKTILLIFGHDNGQVVDYMRDSLLIALAQSNKVNLLTYPNPAWLLESYPEQLITQLYGRGFTMTRCLKSDAYTPLTDTELKKQIDNQTADVTLACSSSNKGLQALSNTARQYLRHCHHLIWVDGTDHGLCTPPDNARMILKREFGIPDRKVAKWAA